MTKKISKKTIIIITTVLVLLSIRLALPYIIKVYVNKVLSELNGYRGSITHVDLWLSRGAYVIHNLKIEKTDGKVPVPFIEARSIDLSVEWKALLHGGIKSEVSFDHANLNFVNASAESGPQTGKETDWTVPLKKLLPIDINRFEIINSTVAYKDFSSDPNVSIDIHNLYFLLTNISNVEKKEAPLPSTLVISGQSIGDGNLEIKGNVNLLQTIPNADINMKFTSIKLVALNNFAKAYGKFDFQSGNLSIFSELGIKNTEILGYIKPVIDAPIVLDWEKEDKNFMQKLWEGAIGITMNTFKNHPKDQFATKIPIEGDLKKIDTKIIPTLINILKNTFIQAIPKAIDNTVNFDKEKDDKNKKFLFFNVGDNKDKNAKKEEKKEKKKEEKKE